MPDSIYPAGWVEALMQTDLVTPQTKAVLNERLQTSHRISPALFDEQTFPLLKELCDCLFPQEEKAEKIPLAVLFEKELTTGKGKGWRYTNMPPVKDTILQGLKATEAEAQSVHNKTFAALTQAQKNELLKRIQTGETESSSWQGLPSFLFFTELLAMLTEIFYSHPLAKESIGDASFADATGWAQLGLNKTEDREPEAINPSAHAQP